MQWVDGMARDSMWRCDGAAPGGVVPGADGVPAFSLHAPRKRAAIPLLIAVPHAGRSYPPSLMKRMRDPQLAAARLEDRLVDLMAFQVAQATGAWLLVAHAPRAMLDLNRAADDVDWEMVTGGRAADQPRYAAGHRARNGLGLVPRRLNGTGELWRQKLSRTELADRIARIHRPYHHAVAQTLAALRDQWGSALLIDLHSMPPLGPGLDKEPAAQFVVGDRFGTSCENGLTAVALEHFEQAGAIATHNRPYAGGYVLDTHGAPVRAIHAMQVEICRSVYLDLRLAEPGLGWAGCRVMIEGLVMRLAHQLGGEANWAQAAE